MFSMSLSITGRKDLLGGEGELALGVFAGGASYGKFAGNGGANGGQNRASIGFGGNWGKKRPGSSITSAERLP